MREIGRMTVTDPTRKTVTIRNVRKEDWDLLNWFLGQLHMTKSEFIEIVVDGIKEHDSADIRNFAHKYEEARRGFVKQAFRSRFKIPKECPVCGGEVINNQCDSCEFLSFEE